jgi:hypothetical protein
MTIEVKVLNDIYKEKILEDEEGNKYVQEYLYKKDVITKRTIHLEDITAVSQTLMQTGKAYKSRCIIFLKGEGPITIKESYEKLKQLRYGQPSIGFKRGK